MLVDVEEKFEDSRPGHLDVRHAGEGTGVSSSRAVEQGARGREDRRKLGVEEFGFCFGVLDESVAVENVGDANVFLILASNVGEEFFVVCVVFDEVVDIGVVGFSAESLGVFFHVFVFLLCFWALSLFRFRVPPLFLSDDSFCGSGDPRLVMFG